MGWGLPLFEISQGIPILRYQKTSKMAVSFSFSAYFPNTEILETRINPRFFALVLGQGFIFVQPSHTCGEQFAHRRFFFILKFCARACSGYLFCPHFSAASCRSQDAPLIFVRCTFLCPHLGQVSFFSTLPKKKTPHSRVVLFSQRNPAG